VTWQKCISLWLLIQLLASAGYAAPMTSLVPAPRPSAMEKERPDFAFFDRASAGLKSAIRPPRKPGPRIHADVPRQAANVVVRPAGPKLPSVAPTNSTRVSSAQVASKPSPIKSTGRSGSVCRVRAIKGEKLSPIAGRLRGCGVKDPVRVTSVSGVTLSQGAIMNCPTAKALNAWVAKGVKPAFGRLGGGVDSLQVVAHYSCRTRNNQSGAKISEHGKGRAIDISAINLRNGASVTVLKGWRDPAQGKVLRSLHKSACGPFGTVLGPDSDRFHRDHFHLDTASNRGRSYCR